MGFPVLLYPEPLILPNDALACLAASAALVEVRFTDSETEPGDLNPPDRMPLLLDVTALRSDACDPLAEPLVDPKVDLDAAISEGPVRTNDLVVVLDTSVCEAPEGPDTGVPRSTPVTVRPIENIFELPLGTEV